MRVKLTIARPNDCSIPIPDDRQGTEAGSGVELSLSRLVDMDKLGGVNKRSSIVAAAEERARPGGLAGQNTSKMVQIIFVGFLPLKKLE